MKYGSHGGYLWLVSEEHHLDDLLTLVPELFLGRYVAVTSIDSGSLVPSEEEKAAGWESRGGIGYSPAISDPEALPRAGYDEWFLFNQPADLGERAERTSRNIFEDPPVARKVDALVNFVLALHRPEMEPLIQFFWGQLEWIRPFAYVSDNDCYLTVVCADEKLFGAVRAALGDPAPADLP